MARTPSSNRSGPPVGGIIAALVVVGVFVILGFVLANSGPNGAAGRDAAATTMAGLDSTLSNATSVTALVRRELPAVTTVPAEVTARNEKYSAPPPMTIDPAKNYTATITTPAGDVEIKLRPDIAPETVNNFVFLAKEGFYDGVPWHRVLENFMAQTGDPSGTGAGGPGYQIKGEVANNPPFDKPGLVAMANSGSPDTAGSQFFITTAPAPWLNGGYTVFGEVTKGQDIVDAIPLRNPDEAPSSIGEQIVKVTITES